MIRAMALDDTDCEQFVRTHARLLTPPLVPEVPLYLADEAIVLWTKTESLPGVLPGTGTRPPPYWAFAWPGGQALARYLIDHPAEVARRTVLDFGSGSGLVAIAAAKAGAYCVCAAETDPLALAAIELNAAANGVFIEPLSQDLIGTNSRWNIVLAGDMFYERPLAERLLPWLRELARAHARVLIADPGRAYFPREGVRKLATYSIPTSRELEDRDIRETSVYELAAL